MQSTLVQIENISSNALLNEVSKLLDLKLSKLALVPPPETDSFITRQNVADMFKISLPTVHAWIHANILKPYKIGNKTRFLLSEVKAAPVLTCSKKEVANV